MDWSDITRKPSTTTLRQFAGMLLLLLVSLAMWRLWQGKADHWTWTMGGLGLGIGVLGLVAPAAVRFVYTGWMIVAFPIGWTVSRLVLNAVFFLIITPLALYFRVTGRDALQVRDSPKGSYWTSKPKPSDAKQYLRQS